MGPEATFRAVMGRFASGVSVVTASVGEVRHAMTATAVCSVSLHPPLVLVCVGKVSRFHSAILEAGRWALSVLAADQQVLADHFSHSGRDLATQFAGVDHELAPVSGAPVISGALGWLDLVTADAHDAGDHTIVVGAVQGGSWNGSGAVPLTYYQGAYEPPLPVI